MHPKQRKILLALDGSEGALMAVDYAAQMPSFREMEAVLFNVFSSMPEYIWDLEHDPQFTSTARQMHAWEVQQRRQMKQYMETASQMLIRSGFSPNAVRVKIQNRKRGIARDILAEAQTGGYDAVLIGRKGISKIQEIVLGSVAYKLLEKINFIPMVLAGGMAPNNRVLVAIDGSENAMRAVKYVSTMLGGHNYQVTLLHVIRGKRESHGLFSTHEIENTARKSIESVFEAARRDLVDAGIKDDKVETSVISGVASRAATVVEEASRNDYGTIVVGRRGLSRVQEFFMGRVGNKIVHMTKHQTVWVVS